MGISATHERKGGVRGPDKQQRTLRDQDPGQGIVRDERGQEQPADRERARQDAGRKAQEEAAETRPQSPGQPAGGE